MPRGGLFEAGDTAFEFVELTHFRVGEGAIENGEVVLMADVGRAEHEGDRGGVPTEGEVPVFDSALKFAVYEKASTGFGGLVVHVGKGEDDVSPGVAREGRFGDLNHGTFFKGNVGPLHVGWVPDVEERTDGVAEEARRFVLGEFEEDVSFFGVIAGDLNGIAIARFQVFIGSEAQPDGDGGVPALVVVTEHVHTAVLRTGGSFFREVDATTEFPAC